MLAMVSVEINLMPNWTFFVQLGIFLSSAIVLNIFVIRPVLRIFDRRSEYTIDAESEAAELNDESEQIESTCDRAIREVLREAHIQRAMCVAKARADADMMAENAKRESKQIAMETDISIDSSEKSISDDIAKNSRIIADEIVARIAG